MNKSIIKGVSYSAFANGINLCVSILSALVIPKLLGVSEYSYWQLYTFYASYVGFFHFGWADGIYLKQGGKKYKDLDQKELAVQFRLYVAVEVFIAFLIILATLFFVHDKNRIFVLICTALCLAITLPRTFLQYLLQTTDRIEEYAKNIIFDRIIYIVGVFFLLIIGVREYYLLLLVDLLARGITLCLLARLCKDVLLQPIQSVLSGVHEAWDNIHIGSKLMFANIAGQLITGIVRISIERNWGIEAFGKISLTMTASTMVMVFISAVSVVLYPMLRNLQKEQLVPVYQKLRMILMLLTFGMLVLYYPMRVIISKWLPQYADSLKYMALLFPICVFESKTNMLSNTYFKAIRKEKEMMLVNWAAVIFTLFFTGYAVFFAHDLTLTIVGLMISIGFKGTLSEIILSRYLHLNLIKDLILEWIIVILFCALSWLVGGWIGEIIYVIVFCLYLSYEWVSR